MTEIRFKNDVQKMDIDFTNVRIHHMEDKILSDMVINNSPDGYIEVTEL